MATARVDTTTPNINSYGDASRDFTSLSTWEAATDTDLVTANAGEVLECFDDAASFDNRVSISGAITDATYFRIIRAAKGEGHDGTSNNGVYFHSTDAGNLIRISESFGSIQDLILTQTFNSASAFSTIVCDTDIENIKIIGCIIFDSANSGASTITGIKFDDSINAVVALCLVENVDEDGFRIASVGNTNYIYNCTAIDNGATGYSQGGVSLTVAKNCSGKGNTTEDFDDGTTDWTGSTNNASADDTAQGSGPRINQTFTFQDAAGNNYKLSNDDAGAQDFGTDLSGDSFFPFDDDIVRHKFKVWDIGFHDPEAQRRRTIIT